MNNFKKWIRERPAISVRQLEAEAGIPRTILNKVLNGHRELPQRYERELLIVAIYYGFKHASL